MADTKISAATAVTTPATSIELACNDGGSSKKITIAQIGSALGIYKKLLTADQSNSTVTPTNVSGLDVTLPAGSYQFQFFIRYQAAATTTGVRFNVNFTGTQTSIVWNHRFAGLIGTASDANADQDSVLAAATVMNVFSNRVARTTGAGGVTLSVDTLNADMLSIIEGIVVVTVAGDLELWHGSEVAAASTVKAGSSVFALRMD